MGMQRRHFLKHTATGGAALLGAGLFPHALMAEWPKAAFEAKTIDEALNALLGSAATTDSSDIDIKAPDIAENGAVVPIQVNASIPDVESIAIIAAKNPVPLIANFTFAEGGVGYVSTRIKMGSTSDVIAVVKAGGKLYTASKEVKVTIGGCGG